MAQVRTGNIFGTVVDDQGNPLPGVTVTLTGTLTAPTPAVTGQRGVFRFLSLAPAVDYALKAELEGFKTVTRGDIIVNAGVNVEIELVMEVGAIAEEVTVTATTPVVDAKKTTVGLNITRDILQALPSARDPWDIINMAPAVALTMDNVGGIDGGQQPGFRARGSSGGSNYWAMDGMAVTETAAVGGSFGYYDYDVFEEMSVTVGGSDVTVQTGGVQVNMVTRRAGNKISFAGRYYLVDPWFQADNFTEELAAEGARGVDQFREFKDFGFNIGIPLIRDKAWFWGAYGVQDIEVTTLYGNNDDTLLSTLAGKLNVQIIPQNRLEIFAQGNRKQKYGRDQSAQNPQGMIQRPVYHFGFPVLKIQDEHMFGNDLFVSLKWGVYDGGFEIVPVMDSDLTTYRIWDQEDDRYYNSHYYYRVKKPAYQTSAVLDYFNDELLGASHNFKIGFEYSDRDQASDDSRWPGNVTVVRNYINPTIDFDGDQLPDIPTSSNFKRLEYYRGSHNENFGTTNLSLFASDTITFGRFNIILGLRYDRQHPFIGAFNRAAIERDVWDGSLSGNRLADEQTINLLDAFLPGFPVPEQDGIDVNGDTYNWVDWSPRLGLTMDVFGDGRTIAKASFSRYGQYMGIGEAGRYRAGGASGWADFWWQDNGDGVVNFTELYWHNIDVAPTYTAYRVFDDAGNLVGNLDDASGSFWGGFDPNDPLASTAPFEQVDPDAQGQRTTEMILSLEHELLPDFAVGANFSYRYYDNFRWWLNYWPDTGVFENSGQWIAWKQVPSNVPGIGSTKDAAGKTYYYQSEAGTEYTPYERIRKRPDYHLTYWGLDITANKRLSNKWMLNASFTYNQQGRHFGDQGYTDPNNIWAFEGQPDTTYFADWIVKLAGLYQLPYNINFSFTYRGRNGWPVREYFDIIDYTVPNTRSREHRVYLTPDRSERLDSYHNLSLRLEKRLNLFEGRIYLMADVFNAFNLAIRERRSDKDYGNYYVFEDASENYFVENINYFRLNNIMNPRVVRFGVRYEF